MTTDRVGAQSLIGELFNLNFPFKRRGAEFAPYR